MINHEILKESLVEYKAIFEKRWPDEELDKRYHEVWEPLEYW